MRYSRLKQLRIAGIIGGAILLGSVQVLAVNEPGCDTHLSTWCFSPKLLRTLDSIKSATVPKLATPAWMEAAPQVATREVTYSLSSRGVVAIDLTEFGTTISKTLWDSRGWSRLGVSFRQVDSGGDVTIFVVEQGQMGSFNSADCDNQPSCSDGKAIAINQSAWQSVPTELASAQIDSARYQSFLVNHEIGHYLGHGNRTCTNSGSVAPVMLPQSSALDGCTFNAWPLAEELYSPKLGIRS